MATHKQYYITCDDCGRTLENEHCEIFGEDSDEIRGEAMDHQWVCYVGSDQKTDYCRKCSEKDNRINDGA